MEAAKSIFRKVTGRDFGRANAWSKRRGNPVAAAIKAACTVAGKIEAK